VSDYLSSVPDSRINCGESGHWWSDHPYIVVSWQRQQVGERVQKCMRVGCPRERVMRISLRTGEQIGGTVYRGKIARIGQTYRSDLRLEQFRRQNG
jgi:hypothetical protein